MAKLTEKQRALHKEYSYQLSRIKKVIKGATQRGFIFPKNVIPPRPDKITRKHVEELKEKTAPSLYKEAQYVEPSTGEVVSGYKGRKSERRKAYYKGRRKQREQKQAEKTYKGRRYEQYAQPEEAEPRPYMPTDDPDMYSDAIINNFYYILSQYSPEATWVLRNWIENLMFKYGRHEVALMLQAGAEQGLIVTWDVIYDEQMQRSYMADMVNYIASIEPEDAEIYGQAFYDALEEDDGYVMVQ